MFANISFTTIHSSCETSLAFVFRLVLSNITLLCERSLDSDAVSDQSIDPYTKDRGTKQHVGLPLVIVPFPEVSFPTHRDAIAELCVVEDFDPLAVVCGAVVVGVERGVLQRVPPEAARGNTQGRDHQSRC